MGNLFKTPKPDPVEPTRMPDPEDDDAERARRRAQAEFSANRGGRASTLLSGPTGSYTSTTLGSG